MEDRAAIGRQLQADSAAMGRQLQANSVAIGRQLPWQSFLNRNHIGKVCVFCVLRVDSENVVPPPKLRFIHVYLMCSLRHQSWGQPGTLTFCTEERNDRQMEALKTWSL